MKGIVRLAIKVFVYVVIVIPVVRGIAGMIFGANWFGWLVGVIAAIALAFWLETTGTSNRILAKIFSGEAVQSTGKAVKESLEGIFEDDGSSPSPRGVETTMKCENCGAQVTLKGGHGKCDACDSAY